MTMDIFHTVHQQKLRQRSLSVQRLTVSVWQCPLADALPLMCFNLVHCEATWTFMHTSFFSMRVNIQSTQLGLLRRLTHDQLVCRRHELGLFC